MFWKRMFVRGMLPNEAKAADLQFVRRIDEAGVIRLVLKLLEKLVHNSYERFELTQWEGEATVEWFAVGATQMVEIFRLPLSILLAVLTRLFIMSGCPIDVNDEPKHGRIKIDIDGRSCEFDVEAPPGATNLLLRVTLTTR